MPSYSRANRLFPKSGRSARFFRSLAARSGSPAGRWLGSTLLSVSCSGQSRSQNPGQRLFDFGRETGRSLFCELTGSDEAAGFRVGITGGGPEGGQGFSSKASSAGRWFHVAVVLDAAHSTLTGYVMGREAGRVENLKTRLEDILDRNHPEENRLFIGRALGAEKPGLEAKLRDLRLYNIALSEEQVRAIAFGASGGMGGGRRRAVEPTAPALRSLVLGLGLKNVPDIVVETTVGTLPRLPVTIPGTYTKAKPARWSGSSGPCRPTTAKSRNRAPTR